MPEETIISDADRKRVASGLHALAEFKQQLDKAEAVGHPNAEEYRARCNHCEARLKRYLEQFPRIKRPS